MGINNKRQEILERHMLDYLDTSMQSEQNKDIIRTFAAGKGCEALARDYKMKSSQIANIITVYVSNTRILIKFLSWCKRCEPISYIKKIQKGLSSESQEVLIQLAQSKSVCDTCKSTGKTPYFIYRAVQNFNSGYVDYAYGSIDILCPFLLSAFRRKNGISLDEAAEACDILPDTLKRYEAGEATPSFETFMKLIIIYNCNEADILGVLSFFKDKDPFSITIDDVLAYLE